MSYLTTLFGSRSSVALGLEIPGGTETEWMLDLSEIEAYVDPVGLIDPVDSVDPVSMNLVSMTHSQFQLCRSLVTRQRSVWLVGGTLPMAGLWVA